MEHHTYASRRSCRLGFLCNDTATTEIYTLSLHAALPISAGVACALLAAFALAALPTNWLALAPLLAGQALFTVRSEEHTSELQSRQYLVCRLLLAKQPQDHGRRFAGHSHRAAPDVTRTLD